MANNTDTPANPKITLFISVSARGITVAPDLWLGAEAGEM
jgi:hypothetical protein